MTDELQRFIVRKDFRILILSRALNIYLYNRGLFSRNFDFISKLKNLSFSYEACGLENSTGDGPTFVR